MSPPKKSQNLPQSPQPSYAFHGSNSSHSKDNGSGGRTYHIPNYATSYANERSNLISVHLEEGTGSSRSVVSIVVIFLLFAAVPLSMIALRTSKSMQNWQEPDSLQGGTVPSHVPTSGIQEGIKAATSGDGAATEDGGAHETPLIAAEKKEAPEYLSRGLTWDNPVPNNCLAFGSRQYSARLQNFPYFSDWIRACQNTEITIHGVTYPHPTTCESKWPFGGVTGFWTIATGEEGCEGKWGKFMDKGCTKKRSRLRRFQARLWDLKDGEDWVVLCSTAPVKIKGRVISRPTLFQGYLGYLWRVGDRR